MHQLILARSPGQTLACSKTKHTSPGAAGCFMTPWGPDSYEKQIPRKEHRRRACVPRTPVRPVQSSIDRYTYSPPRSSP
ncbi:uncharacterized protein UV8b_04412 [Ustilaginoidea virens]|uniref:Uncharacterized protein n=1 Tax=Ustilaginoidea virens TaxID=1159556 RepID=A0A8E5HRF3_USTVR|nr:uncharacterized protein UV8b_04412 [Ustilaginoidea virens]QUC20171.1 hypothetical protein UV8b_04412 [Ustilaginoidea virens]